MIFDFFVVSVSFLTLVGADFVDVGDLGEGRQLLVADSDASPSQLLQATLQQTSNTVWQCNFEDICRSLVTSSRNGAYNWVVTGRATRTNATGPEKDHTTGRGRYVFVSASLGEEHDVATLYTTPFYVPKQLTQCLSVWYHMYGADTYRLDVIYYNVNDTSKGYYISRKRGDHGNQWNRIWVQFVVNRGDHYSLLFQARRGPGELGDIALDDFEVTEGNCTVEPPQLDGTWSHWSRYGECTSSCGVGDQIRSRSCDPPGTCAGDAQMTRSCNIRICVEWSDWEPWTPCSATCGEGTEVRSRSCDSPNDCPGTGRQTRTCFTSQCPGLSVWNRWSSWAKCSVTCGVGRSRRARVCNTGSGCTGGSNTESKVCVKDDCPPQSPTTRTITWSTWTQWSRCSVSCGEGLESRRRECSSNNLCEGDSTETRTCNVKPCIRQPVWSQWSECTQTCGEGEKTRTKTCNELGACDGTDKERQMCIVATCPVTWSAWSAWTDCDSTCGKGKQNRDRSCPDGSCLGFSNEIRNCELLACPQEAEPVWSEWGDWGGCTVSCGTGVERRLRECSKGSCQGEADEQRTCNMPACPRPEWLEWNRWSSCSTSCGAGFQTRRRTCSIPGRCRGVREDRQSCSSAPCSSWSEWTAWSECSRSCGGGAQSRTRSCTRDGECSPGRASERRLCSEDLCPEWLEWEAWSACSVSCGIGTETRTRECPAGEAECGSNKEETRNCLKTDCPPASSWSEWSAWSQCSRSCGGGVQSRSRNCPRDGECTRGRGRQNRICNGDACPEWSDWEDWGACSVTCGSGLERRVRECRGQGGGCQGDGDETRTCERAECPPAPSWRPWTAWGGCTETCDGGVQSRTRDCTVRGECSGRDQQSRACNEQQCITEATIWTLWSRYSECTRTCGGGIQKRQRTCVQGNCVEENRNSRACNTHRCGLEDFWGSWEEWGPCSRNCGPGDMTRRRACLATANESCEGSGIETKNCNQRDCPATQGWSLWSAWSSCSVSCGRGRKQRTRSCTSGSTCVGTYRVDKKSCYRTLCSTRDVRGWTGWNSWGRCSANCDYGDQKRQRSCSSRNCLGENSDWRMCAQQECQHSWMTWLGWSSCTVSCGVGLQSRWRRCDGRNCQGDPDEMKICNLGVCKGTWEAWRSWGSCSVPCGVGLQKRVRTCPLENCDGSGIEARQCNKQC